MKSLIFTLLLIISNSNKIDENALNHLLIDKIQKNADKNKTQNRQLSQNRFFPFERLAVFKFNIPKTDDIVHHKKIVKFVNNNGSEQQWERNEDFQKQNGKILKDSVNTIKSQNNRSQNLENVFEKELEQLQENLNVFNNENSDPINHINPINPIYNINPFMDFNPMNTMDLMQNSMQNMMKHNKNNSHSFSKQIVQTYENDGKSTPKLVTLGKEKEEDDGKIIREEIIHNADDAHGHKMDIETEQKQLQKYHDLYDTLDEKKNQKSQSNMFDNMQNMFNGFYQRNFFDMFPKRNLIKQKNLKRQKKMKKSNETQEYHNINLLR